MHLVGLTVGMYCDAQTNECQINKLVLRYSYHAYSYNKHIKQKMYLITYNNIQFIISMKLHVLTVGCHPQVVF